MTLHDIIFNCFRTDFRLDVFEIHRHSMLDAKRRYMMQNELGIKCSHQRQICIDGHYRLIVVIIVVHRHVQFINNL